MILTKKQTQALDTLEDSETKEFVFGGGAGGGKSYLGCYWIIKNCLKYKGTRWLIGRSKLKTLKDTTLQSFFAVCREQGLEANKHYTYNGQANTITFFNDSTVLLKDLFLYPSDPNFDELGSLEITGAFIDECNQVVYKAWQIVMSRIRYRLDEYALLPKIFGSCNPSKNWVYNRFYMLENVGDRKFLQSLVTDNPNISKHYIENLKRLDNNSKERLLYGNWDYDDDPTKLYDFEKINDMFTNSFVERGEKYLSADIALQGSDKFVVVIWSGYVIEKIYKIDKCDAKEAENFIRKFSEIHRVPRSNIVYDHDGLGAFLGSYLSGVKSFVNNSSAINGENYQNLKSQCAFKLADKINNNEMYCEDQEFRDIIIQEFDQIKQKDADKDGKIKIEGKDKVKERLGRSPDFYDAIMMRMIFSLTPNDTGIISEQDDHATITAGLLDKNFRQKLKKIETKKEC